MPKVEYGNPKLWIDGKSGNDYIQLTADGIRSVAKCVSTLNKNDKDYVIKGHVEDEHVGSKYVSDSNRLIYIIYISFLILTILYLAWAYFIDNQFFWYTLVANMLRGTYIFVTLLMLFEICFKIFFERFRRVARFHSAEHMVIKSLSTISLSS